MIWGFVAGGMMPARAPQESSSTPYVLEDFWTNGDRSSAAADYNRKLLAQRGNHSCIALRSDIAEHISGRRHGTEGPQLCRADDWHSLSGEVRRDVGLHAGEPHIVAFLKFRRRGGDLRRVDVAPMHDDVPGRDGWRIVRRKSDLFISAAHYMILLQRHLTQSREHRFPLRPSGVTAHDVAAKSERLGGE
ncbi:hypothetical protein RSWS8N_08560 [Cereibacter sphaeroides WS8N]|nr:hypothetical protein RSWS8N_08560 [Cereibacter sphaeroides WS8N]